MSIRAIAVLVVFGVIAFFGLGTIFGSFYTIDQTERGVLLMNGAFVETVPPGLHYKLPYVESIYKINMQTFTYTWDKMNAYSADQQPADMKVSVTMHVAPDKVAEMYSRFGGDVDAAVQKLISPHVNQEVKVVFGNYNAATAITKRGQLNADATQAIIKVLSYDPVFVIESVQVENIDFSKEYIHSVEARMQAEVEVQRQEQNLRQEKIKADIAVTQATGRAQSVVAEAKANADAIKLKGDAEAAAIKAKGDALGSNPNLVQLMAVEKWSGNLPTSMIPSTTVPFINIGK